MTSELRQLRRVRWGVRLTLALGISASLAANVLHARHLLIDQIISGWPPVAVFATIEAIARVPIRRRWLAVIRMAGLGFVAGIAFWVSYWHMASVAAAHGENGSKYLLPLSVDGLVVVSSISLVELTGQISAVEATARAATARAATEPPPAEHRVTPGVPAPLQPVPEPSIALQDGRRSPGFELAPPAVAPAAPRTVQPAALPATPPVTVTGASTGDAPAEPVPADARPTPQRRADTPAPGTATTVEPAVEPIIDTVVEPFAAAVTGPKHGGDRTDGRTDDRVNGRADEVPPDNPSKAILWWRDKDPTLTLSQIAAKVGRSERTVRRTLDSAAAIVVPASAGQPAGGDAAPRRPTNGATVDGLAGSVAPT